MMETERIRIYPASREQMELMIDAEQDDDLRKAYGEMLEGSLSHPEGREWYAMWMIEKTDGTRIGDLCFKGNDAGRNPEIGYGILEAFQGLGYASEAVRLALQWAFRHPGVKAVEAENVLIKEWNAWSINTAEVNCDYYNFIQGDSQAVNSFRGEFMSQYSWAEMTIGTIVKNGADYLEIPDDWGNNDEGQ